MEQKNQSMFSIITVCFNEKERIGRTIESVLNQSCQDYEYIVCDGGSNDGTLKIAESYKNDFARKGIRYRVHSERDGGIYFGMNMGVSLATGRYLNFMNAGDGFYNQEVLQHVSYEIQKYNSDIFYGDVIVTEKGYGKLSRGDEKRITEGMTISHQSMFIKTQLLRDKPYDVKYKSAADWDFVLSMKQENKIFHKMDLIIAFFSAGGVSTIQYRDTVDECLKVAESHGIPFDYQSKLKEAKKSYKKTIQKEKLPAWMWGIYSRVRGRKSTEWDSDREEKV